MANLIHVIPEPERAISEAKRVLRPGGRLVVVSYTGANMKLLDRLGLIYRFLRIWGKPPSGGIPGLTLDKMKAMLIEERFEITEAEMIGARTKAVFVSAVSPSA